MDYLKNYYSPERQNLDIGSWAYWDRKRALQEGAAGSKSSQQSQKSENWSHRRFG